MRRDLRWSLLGGFGLLWVAVVGGAVRPGYASGQVSNQVGYGGAPQMMVAPTVATPDFHGMTLKEAQAANVLAPAKGATEKPTQQKIFVQFSTTGPVDGVVDSQKPEAGTKVYPGRGVATLVMKPLQVVVPALGGLTVAEARSRLSQSSLILGNISGDETQLTATQIPLAGTSVPAMSAVNVVMAAPTGVVGASGDEQPVKVVTTVPNLKNLAQKDATLTLQEYHLAWTFLGSHNGIVVGQTPEAGAKVAEGTRVRVVMGLQEEVILVPQQRTLWPPTWIPALGWFLAGGLVLFGTVGAFLKGTKFVPPVTTSMVANPNASSAKLWMKSEPTVCWSVQFRDRAAVGTTAIVGGNEIKAERKV